jgi:hypothetical protein
VDRYHFNADPDQEPTFHFDADPDPDQDADLDPDHIPQILHMMEIDIFFTFIPSNASLHCFIFLISVIDAKIFNVEIFWKKGFIFGSAKMLPIRPDPDPQCCLTVYKYCSYTVVFFLLYNNCASQRMEERNRTL